MKTLIKRIQLAVASSMLVLVGAAGFVAPSAAAVPIAPPCEPVIGEDGEPVNICSPEPVVDTVAPHVSINNPDAGVTLKRNQTLLVTALAADNVGVVKVELYANGSLLSTSNGNTGGASWTPTQKGTNTLTAKAYDAAGNVGTAILTVTVR